jgi:hypothetical protein
MSDRALRHRLTDTDPVLYAATHVSHNAVSCDDKELPEKQVLRNPTGHAVLASPYKSINYVLYGDAFARTSEKN